MNGVTTVSFLKDLNSALSKKNGIKSSRVNGQLNNSVGMQKGKNLFTTQHQISPQPTVDVVAPAKQNGDKIMEKYARSKHATAVEGINSGEKEGTYTTNIKNYPLNTRARSLEYERRNWAQDETTRLPDGKIPAKKIGGSQLTDAISTINAMTQNKSEPQRPIDNWRKFKAKVGTRIRRAAGMGPNIPRRA